MSRQMTGAEMIVEALKDQGVDTIFGYPGGAVLPIYDALFHQNKVRHVLVRHEQGAGHAAEGYARSTGKVGVLLVTSGPGATNAVTALTGSFDTTATLDYAGVFSLCNGPDTLRDLMTHAARHAGETAFQLARLLLHSFPEAAQHHSLLTQAGQAFELHNPDAALSLLRQEPLDQLAATWFLRGSIFQKLQKWGDAINCYARCLELDPRHQKAETGLAMVRQILSFRNPDLLNP
mgnify:CR=1 FL=1